MRTTTHARPARLASPQTAVRFVLFVLMASAAHGTLVTVQSQTQEDMDAMTAAVNLASASDYSGNARVTLGTIEATMSRVVDMESEFLVTVPQSVPTLRLLQAIEFDSASQTWHLVYEVMGREVGGGINQFRRTLYLTKGGTAHSGDHENACLSADVSEEACLEQLAALYFVPSTPLTATGDHLEFGNNASVESLGIHSTLTPGEHSLVERLDLFLPHAVVKSQLARRETRSSATFGEQTQYSFGVGMLFLLAGKNTILFDKFDLLENAHLQTQIAKSVSYSVAKHVSFFTEVVHSDIRVRLVSVEYMVEAGHVLHDISASVNGWAVTSEDCRRAQMRLEELADRTCLAGRRICEIETYLPPSGGEVWVTYTMPIPADVAVSEDELLVNTLLDTRDLATGTQLFSSINFKTPNSPRPVCTDVTVTAFNPTIFARATLYESTALRRQDLRSSTHALSNVTVDGVAALTMADALMTLVLGPANSSPALAYFEQNPDERVRVDELYMSHAKPSVDFGRVRNTMHAETTGTTAAGSGRRSMVLDAGLLLKCPLESAPDFVYGPAAFACVTTQDYGPAGALRRPVSGVATNFVYEVRGDGGDLQWLRRNIFGDSFQGRTAADAFLQRVQALVPAEHAAFARTFWIWPLYAWPNEAPVGLKDKTLLSLAWSIGPDADSSGRRLLSLHEWSATSGARRRPASRVHLYDLYRRHIDVQALRRRPQQALGRTGIRRRDEATRAVRAHNTSSGPSWSPQGKFAPAARPVRQHALPRPEPPPRVSA